MNGIIQEDGTRAGGIRQYYESGQPVLVGSISIEKSEKIAELLKKAGIPHQVLNAKQHEREAKIIAQAGRKGAVTVSTNMAGRGTDILLGGNPEAMTREYCLKNKLAMPYAPAGAVIGAGPAPRKLRRRPTRAIPRPQRRTAVAERTAQATLPWCSSSRKAKSSRCLSISGSRFTINLRAMPRRAR